jgi:hypothetical protein
MFGPLASGIGDGKGKSQLTVSSDEPVRVQSLLETPTGFITNLLTSAQQVGWLTSKDLICFTNPYTSKTTNLIYI